MKVQLRFFAVLRERVGQRESEHELRDGERVAELWSALCEQWPQLRDYTASMSFAVNREYVDGNHVLHDGDEIALIPPVSGG